MGRIARILSFVRTEFRGAAASDVKSDPGGGPNITSQHFQPAGDDAHPLPGDYVATSQAPGTGRESAVGYLDPRNLQKAGAGEKRIYGRDPSDGSQVVEVWLKATGEATMVNANGYLTLRPDGVVEINGATIDTEGRITSPTRVVTPLCTVNGVEVDQHDHPQDDDSGGNSEQDTGPMQ